MTVELVAYAQPKNYGYSLMFKFIGIPVLMRHELEAVIRKETGINEPVKLFL